MKAFLFFSKPLKIIVAVFAVVLLNCQHKETTPLKTGISTAKELCFYHEKLPSMGAFIEFQFQSRCNDSAKKQLVLNIKNYLDLLETEMSLYQSQSAISILNATGRSPNVSSSFEYLIEQSKQHSINTNGAFNILILPVLKEIQSSFALTHQPPKHLSQFKNLLDLNDVILAQQQIFFRKKKMMITFDGIAKGYAVDQIANQLQKQGINNFLINFSGNMRWQGRREDSKYWQIAIWNPITQEAQKLIETESGAIASSGTDRNHYSKDQKWHHIINPRTLKPADTILASSALGPSAMICDLLSTGLFIFSKTEREEIFKKNYPEYSFWVIDKNYKEFSTVKLAN